MLCDCDGMEMRKLEKRIAKLERENKALRAGQAALLEAMGEMSSAFAQCVETMQDLGGGSAARL